MSGSIGLSKLSVTTILSVLNKALGIDGADGADAADDAGFDVSNDDVQQFQEGERQRSSDFTTYYYDSLTRQSIANYEARRSAVAADEAELALQHTFQETQLETSYDALGIRAAQNAAASGLEGALLAQQYAEKLKNLRAEIANNILSNTWNRLKAIAQGFKY